MPLKRVPFLRPAREHQVIIKFHPAAGAAGDTSNPFPDVCMGNSVSGYFRQLHFGNTEVSVHTTYLEFVRNNNIINFRVICYVWITDALAGPIDAEGNVEQHVCQSLMRQMRAD
eukprot:gene20199-biopygen877